MFNKNKKVLITASLAVLILASIILYVLSPRPTAIYFVKALNAIGVTDGVNPVPARDDVRIGGLGESPYAVRSYLGDLPYDVVKTDMLKRVKQAGFKNARWRDASSLEAEGILATCKGVMIFVRVYPRDNVPIEIGIGKASYPDAPNCPWL